MAAGQNLANRFALDDGVEDLSFHHSPISKDFDVPIPQTPQEWDKYKLSQDQIVFFEENGYLLGVPVLTEKQVDILVQELSALADQENLHPGHGLFHEFHSNESGDPNNVLLHCLGHWRITKGFHDLVFHPAISVPSSQLLGGHPVRFWHDQVFSKPAHYGGCVSWHQDYSYWVRTVPMGHLTIHIALDDQTVENGCLHYIAGSHKWTDKPLPVVDRHFGDMESIKTILTEEQKEKFIPIPMLLKKGQACFHHALEIHGSYANHSDKPRRAAVVNVFCDGTISDTNQPLLDGLPIYPPATKLQGQFFPLLYDPNH